MAYNYILQNLEQEKFESLKQKISQIQGIKSVEIEVKEQKTILSYEIQKNLSEYDIFVLIDQILQQENIDIAFEDEKPILQQDTKQDIVQENLETNQEKTDKKKKNKFAKLPDYSFRLMQVVLAMLLYIILANKLFIVSAMCLVLASYEIFYDTLTDLFKKKITDNLVISFSIIILSIFSYLNFAFILASGFSLVKIVSMLIINIFRKKNYEFCYLETIETANGEEIDLESIETNQLIICTNKVYLPCEITDGEVQVKRVNKVVETVGVGDKLNYGDIISKKQSVIAKVLSNFKECGFKDMQDKQRDILQQVEDVGYTKKEKIIYFCLAIASLLYIFIKPFFAESYLYGLTFDSIRAIVIFAFSYPILNFFKVVSKELLVFKLKQNIDFTNLDKVKGILNLKGFVYQEDLFLTNGEINSNAYGMLREVKDLGVANQTAVSSSATLNDTCNALKLKNRLNSTDNQEYKTLIQDSLLVSNGVATINGQQVFEFKKDEIRSIPKTVRVVKRSKLLSKLTCILTGIIQIGTMILSLSGLISIGACFVTGLILLGLVGVMQLLEIVEL